MRRRLIGIGCLAVLSVVVARTGLAGFLFPGGLDPGSAIFGIVGTIITGWLMREPRPPVELRVTGTDPASPSRDTDK